MSSELTSDRVPPAHIGSGDSLDSVMEPPVRYYEGKTDPLDKQLASVQGTQILGCYITQPVPPTTSIAGRGVDRKFPVAETGSRTSLGVIGKRISAPSCAA